VEKKGNYMNKQDMVKTSREYWDMREKLKADVESLCKNTKLRHDLHLEQDIYLNFIRVESASPVVRLDGSVIIESVLVIHIEQEGQEFLNSQICCNFDMNEDGELTQNLEAFSEDLKYELEDLGIISKDEDF
jgi:hypothetical protein